MSTPLPSPPFHLVPNINNLRDAALFPSSPLRPSLLFRSADVSTLTPQNWTALSTLGITHVFDLRSAPEVTRNSDSASPDPTKPNWLPNMHASGISRTWVPVFREEDYSPERLAARYVKYMDKDVHGFVSAYQDILRNGGEAYATIFRYLINHEGKGVLVHCTAGKDRTGLFFALLFDFLGIERGVIADEYHLTELGLQAVREEVVLKLMASPAFKEYVAAQKGGEGTDEEKGRAAALRMVGARRETMVATLEMVDREFGGAEKYMREMCGLEQGELDALRRNLLVL